MQNYFLAVASIALGKEDTAIALLEKDLVERGNYMAAIAVDPILDDLRFATLVQKVAAAKLD